MEKGMKGGRARKRRELKGFFFFGGGEVDVGCPFKKIWAPGMMCMPVKDLGRVSSCWGKKESEAVLYAGWVVLFFFYLLDLTGQSWAVLFFSWR